MSFQVSPELIQTTSVPRHQSWYWKPESSQWMNASTRCWSCSQSRWVWQVSSWWVLMIETLRHSFNGDGCLFVCSQTIHVSRQDNTVSLCAHQTAIVKIRILDCVKSEGWAVFADVPQVKQWLGSNINDPWTTLSRRGTFFLFYYALIIKASLLRNVNYVFIMNKYLNNKYVLYCIFSIALGYRRDGMWVNTSVKLASC